MKVDCSDEYRNDVGSAFSLLTPFFKSPWRELDSKLKENVYKLVATAFINELQRLEHMHGPIIPENLIRFLLGDHDYYKLLRKGRTTQIQPINIHGTLAHKCGTSNPVTIIGRLPMSSRFLKIELHSWNRLRVYFDAGWQIEMRVHNKDTLITQSLAFETEVLGQPASLVTLLMPRGLERDLD